MHNESVRRLILTAVAIVGCSTDQFVTGDATTDGSSDVSSDVVVSSLDAGDGCAFNATPGGNCFGASCSATCCVTSEAVTCSSASCSTIALHCTHPADCASDTNNPVCCLEGITAIDVAGCPRMCGGATLTSECVAVCETLNDGGPGYARMCADDGQCVGVGQGKCIKSTFVLNPGPTFGLCQ